MMRDPEDEPPRKRRVKLGPMVPLATKVAADVARLADGAEPDEILAVFDDVAGLFAAITQARALARASRR